MKDELGNRMKDYYENRTQTYLPRRTYTIIRLDGKAFHTFTRNFDKPFDGRLTEAMLFTTIYLCENIQGCKFGYTQSDEISLLLTDFDNLDTDAWFDGKVQKIVSVSAAMASSYFNKTIKFDHPYKELEPLAIFDSRVFTIPTKVEVENYFIWRQKDCIRNSISAVAQSHFSSKQLHGKSTNDRLEMLKDIGDGWNTYPYWLKRGAFVIKSNNTGKFGCSDTPDFVNERNKLSEQILNYDN